MEKKLQNTCIEAYVRTLAWLDRNQMLVLFFFGIALLYCGTLEYSHAQKVTGGYDGTKYGDVCKKILDSHKDGYGALLTAAAGLGAILASAMGGFKAAWGLLVVAIGSFILNTYKDLWFQGTCA